jgi:hypothetical protein
MSANRLSAIQERVLVALAALRPQWTLTGGGALVGFYTMHRETRDLDLFFTTSEPSGPSSSMRRARSRPQV